MAIAKVIITATTWIQRHSGSTVISSSLWSGMLPNLLALCLWCRARWDGRENMVPVIGVRKLFGWLPKPYSTIVIPSSIRRLSCTAIVTTRQSHNDTEHLRYLRVRSFLAAHLSVRHWSFACSALYYSQTVASISVCVQAMQQSSSI